MTRKFRPVLFIFQMSQLIFIRIAEIPFFKARSRFTNACWWFALSLGRLKRCVSSGGRKLTVGPHQGFPVIGILYVRDFTLNK